MSDQPVVFSECATASGHVVGLARLNAERSLNALNAAMIDALSERLAAWADDPRMVAVVLRGSGERAFCAGGDVLAVYRAIRAAGGAPSAEAEAFFEAEYRLDHALHTYPKPLLVWGSGVVMGGGLGLLTGGSHRVVTETSLLAMPEITIGLYPDVAGTWFLNRMPGRVGLFVGLTGARMNAADALYTGLANTFITGDRWPALLAALDAARWRGRAEWDHATLSAALRALARESHGACPAGQIEPRREVIDEITEQPNVSAILDALRAAAADDPWLTTALASLEKGSPTSARVIHEQLRRGRHLSLAECFARELGMSAQFTRGHDFPEGVRSLLVDKDRTPRWEPAELAAVDDDLVEAHFRDPAAEQPVRPARRK